MRNLWRVIAQTGGSKAYSLITGVVVLALTARYLGPEGRGVLAVLTTWSVGFAACLHLSLGQVTLHRAAGRDDRRWLDEALAALFVWCGIATLLAWCGAALLYFVTSGRIFNGVSPWLLATGLLLVPLLVWEQYSSSLLMALNRLDIANAYQVVGRTVTLIFSSIGLIVIGPWVACVVLANVLGQVVVALGGLHFMRGNFVSALWLKNLPSLVRSGLQLHFNAVGTFLFASVDILILNYVAGPAETGYYQLGVQLLAVLMVLPQAVSNVLYAKVAELGPNRAWLIQRRLIQHAMIIVGISVLFGAYFSENIVLIVAGPSFLPTVDVFRWQLLSVFGMSLAAMMAPQWIGRGLFKTASILTLIFGIVNSFLLLWLVPEYGKIGAAWASVATFTATMLTNGAFAMWCSRQQDCAIKI